MAKNSAIKKVLIIVLALVLVVMLAFVIFACSGKPNNSQIASTSLTVLDSEDNINLNKTLPQNFYETPTNPTLKNFANSLQSSNKSLFEKFRLTYLEYSMQIDAFKKLSNDSAFSSNDKKYGEVSGLIETYKKQQNLTLEAIKIFNQDFVASTTSENTKQNELNRVVVLLNEQNKSLIKANNILLQNLVDFNFGSSNTANQDFSVVMQQILQKQSGILQKQIDDVFADVNVEKSNGVFNDSKMIFNTYLVCKKFAFVYSNINAKTDITCETFVGLYKIVPQFDVWLESSNKTEFMASIADTADFKANLLNMTNFIEKLSQEAM